MLFFVAPMLVVGLLQNAAARRGDPDESQRIAATLASWGLALDELSIPVGWRCADCAAAARTSRPR